MNFIGMLRDVSPRENRRRKAMASWSINLGLKKTRDRHAQPQMHAPIAHLDQVESAQGVGLVESGKPHHDAAAAVHQRGRGVLCQKDLRITAYCVTRCAQACFKRERNPQSYLGADFEGQHGGHGGKDTVGGVRVTVHSVEQDGGTSNGRQFALVHGIDVCVFAEKPCRLDPVLGGAIGRR